jgi:outer membrane protein OmpA-like peptidoglycan-associated protein
MNKLKTTFFLLIITLSLSAQNQGNIWYFGDGIGLDFNQNPPALLTNGKMITNEGCSSISDENGNLLLYTDGIKVWNKNHQIIPNADDLHGHFSSTQSGIIAKKPESDSIYYVFTVDAVEQGLRGLEFAEIDISKNNGIGEVIQKHQQLLPNTAEKVTGIAHENGIDFWIITHQWRTNAFYAFLVTKNGVRKKGTISKIGAFHEGNSSNALGYLKASPKGDRLALAINHKGDFELFDFDNSTGKITNPITLTTIIGNPYGVEFSPNGQFLYTSSAFAGEINQYDLTAKDLEKSKINLRKADTKTVGALQIAPNGQIYYQVSPSHYIGTIANPNKKGKTATVNDNVIFIGEKKTFYGLPTFLQTYFTQENIETYLTENPIQEISELESNSKQPFKFQLVINEQKYNIVDQPNSGKAAKKSLSNVNVGENKLDFFKRTNNTGILEFDGTIDHNYTFTFVKKGYFNKVIKIDTTAIREQLTNLNRKVTFEITMEKVYKNIEITIDNIFYDYNSANVQETSLSTLDELATLLKQNPQISIELAAHTDCRGKETFNFDLSERRADWVTEYLIRKNINPKRLQSFGYGETKPATICVCESCTEEEHQQNRRTTFRVK